MPKVCPPDGVRTDPSCCDVDWDPPRAMGPTQPVTVTRLKLSGLIERRRHSVAIFYTKVHDRLLRPFIAADLPHAPVGSAAQARSSTATCHVHGYTEQAQFGDAA